MADGAIELGALERRPLDLMLVEQIEDRALPGVERDDLDRLAVVHLADVDVVVEVERARRLRRDLLVLEAGLRKHQRLRADRNLEMVEDRLEVAVARLPVERGFAAVESLLQLRHRVVDVAAVVDRLVAERHEPLVAHRDLAVHGRRQPSERQPGGDHAGDEQRAD